MSAFSIGDRIAVLDPGLAQLRELMQQATGSEPAPNHHATVTEMWNDGAPSC